MLTLALGSWTEQGWEEKEGLGAAKGKWGCWLGAPVAASDNGDGEHCAEVGHIILILQLPLHHHGDLAGRKEWLDSIQ